MFANHSVLKYLLLINLFGCPFRIYAQHFYLGLGYTTMDPKSTKQASYYLKGFKPRLELEYAINAQYEKKFGKDLSLSRYLSYVHNTNKNPVIIETRYFPKYASRHTVDRFSFNNISHLISVGTSINVDLIRIKRTSWGISPYFNGGLLFKKQAKAVDFDDFKYAALKLKPFNLEAYPFLYGRINRFLVQFGVRAYSLKYFDEVIQLRYSESKPASDNSNPLKFMANIAYRL